MLHHSASADSTLGYIAFLRGQWIVVASRSFKPAVTTVVKLKYDIKFTAGAEAIKLLISMITPSMPSIYAIPKPALSSYNSKANNYPPRSRYTPIANHHLRQRWVLGLVQWRGR